MHTKHFATLFGAVVAIIACESFRLSRTINALDRLTDVVFVLAKKADQENMDAIFKDIVQKMDE